MTLTNRCSQIVIALSLLLSVLGEVPLRAQEAAAEAAPPKEQEAVVDPDAGEPTAAVKLDVRPAQITIFTLKYASAVECTTRLKDLKFKALITADTRTNSILVSGDKDELLDIEAILRRLDSASPKPAKQEPHADSRIENQPGATLTAEASRLRDNLQTQESAAAAEAGTIRKLQANGQAEQNQTPIAEYQRKLKNMLSNAFDLKLQLEEMQVKELQSRLSRLERQIDQRKKLREKIIARRASELIEGEVLRWDSTAVEPTKLAGQIVGDDKQPWTPASPAVVSMLRERLDRLFREMQLGNAKPAAVLSAIHELAQAEPPDAQAQLAERLQALLEYTQALRSANEISKAELLAIEAANEQTRPGRHVPLIPTESSRTAEADLWLSSYQDMARKLATMNSSVAEAEEDLTLATSRFKTGQETNEIVRKFQRALEQAIRNRKLIQDEYAAVLRDLELQIESAQQEVDAATKDAERLQNMARKGAVSQKESNDAQLRLRPATLALERLKVRSGLYRKAGEGAVPTQRDSTTLPP